MFRITKDWLKANSRNGNSGWNKDQLRLVEVPWPPFKGWIDHTIGIEISDDKKKEFEALSGKSQEGIKIDAGKENMATNPVYRTRPDGKGGWHGEWIGEARYPWTSKNCPKAVHSPKSKDLLSND
jgi:hypothetical protein